MRHDALLLSAACDDVCVDFSHFASGPPPNDLQVVFIGRDLPFDELRKTFEQCRIDATEKYQPKVDDDEDEDEIPKSQMHVQAQVRA